MGCFIDVYKRQAVDYAVEENREKVSKYSGSSVIKIWNDGRVKFLRE